MKVLIFPILLALLTSCTPPLRNSEKAGDGLSYASGFEIIDNRDFTRLIIKRPWQKSKNEDFSYILAKNPAYLPDSLKSEMIIKIPVKRVITFSSTHIGFISALGKSSTIVGVSGKDYVCDSIVRTSLQNNECQDIGFAPNINYETILSLKPDVVFLYGLDPSVSSIVKRFSEVGIPAVLVSEYLEESPLGKAEWIRFFSAFYENESAADSIYHMVEHNYNMLKDSVHNLKNNPSVMVGLPWKDTWYMAGGQSFTAKFIEDAGGDYLWSDNSSTDFIPLDLESVFQKAVNADIWINSGTASSIDEILSLDSRFGYLPACKYGKVFNNNAKISAGGGNDFWESGTVRPDIVLNDLVKIFHPGNQELQSLFYYTRLK